MIRLDVDRGRPLTLGRMAWLLGRAGYQPMLLRQVRSPSGQGWHVEVAVTPTPTPLEAVALQAVLGSDRGREACNLRRARMVTRGQVSPFWCTRWNVLYQESGKRRA